MACELLNGIVGVCEYSTSGVEKLWLTNKANITGTTVYDDCTQVTGLTWSGGTAVVYEIESALDTITFTDDLVVNGSRRNFLQTINFALGSIDCTILGTLEDIGLSNLVAFVKLSDGTYRAFGLSSAGLRATVMSDTSGTAAGNDGNIAVTISGSSTHKGAFIESAFAATFLV
jgi:hypothetical protein